MLWTVGPKFDPKCQEEVKAEVFSSSDLPWLDELEQTDSSVAETLTNETKSSGFKRKKKYDIQKTWIKAENHMTYFGYFVPVFGQNG